MAVFCTLVIAVECKHHLQSNPLARNFRLHTLRNQSDNHNMTEEERGRLMPHVPRAGYPGKTLLDRSAALVGLLLLLPVLAVIFLAISSQRDGPALFRQKRVGRFQKPFTLYKFRTLPVDTAHVPTHELGQAQTNRVGRFVRRTKLDELPQLWNVLRGDMSLVGPRPGLPTQTELIAERDQRGLFDLRPGITGYAQIHGIDMRDPVRLAQADMAYAQSISLLGDLAIISATFGLPAGKRDNPV